MIADAAGIVLLGVVLGSMIFFAAVVTPSIFRLLPIEAARPLLRALFPTYYWFCGGVTLVAAFLLLIPPSQVPAGIFVGLAAAGFFLAERELIPRLDMLRASADADGYERLHKASVVLNTAQMAVISAVLLQQLLLRSGT